VVNLKYLIAVKTAPDRTMDDQAILSLWAEAQEAIPCGEVWKASVEDPLDEAFIDSQTLRDEIADGKIDPWDFISYCEARSMPAYDERQNIVPTSAQGFLTSRLGQGVFVVAFPLNEAAARMVFARLVDFAKERELQLLSLAPGAGMIDLKEPGTLPPRWHNWLS